MFPGLAIHRTPESNGVLSVLLFQRRHLRPLRAFREGDQILASRIFAKRGKPPLPNVTVEIITPNTLSFSATGSLDPGTCIITIDSTAVDYDTQVFRGYGTLSAT